MFLSQPMMAVYYSVNIDYKTAAAMLAAYDADVFLSSVNAMTDDGILVNIDGNSNRVSAVAFGPKKVIFIVGMNKVCGDVDHAMKRARNVAATTNAQRFGLSTPCSVSGTCFNSEDSSNFCHAVGTADRTEQAAQRIAGILLLYACISHTMTSGESASATVCTRQNFLHLSHARILVNIELL